MNFIKNNKILSFLFLVIIVALSLLLISYIISKQINSKYFYGKAAYSKKFLQPYIVQTFEYQKESINIYSLLNESSKNIILYFANSDGVMPSILNSKILESNVFVLSYPQLKQNKNFQSLMEILNLTIKYLNSIGIENKDIILFGQKITANVIFDYSRNKEFKAIMLMNLLNNPQTLCVKFFKPILCKLIKPSFDITKENKNPIYFFFNDVKSAEVEQSYALFNSISADEKFLFELPGTNINYNFNHIIQFYTNTLLHSAFTDELNYPHLEIDEDYNGEIINADGLLNPEEYID